MNPIDRTIDSYRKNFLKYAESTVTEPNGAHKAWIDHFIGLLSHMPGDPRLLEIGSATGRDARYFRSKGVNVICSDVVPEALKKLRKDGFRAEYYDFRYRVPDSLHFFDAIYANAVLVHAPREILQRALYNFNQVLNEPHGLVALSFKNGSGEETSTHKLDAPRYFQYYTVADIKEHMTKALFDIVYLDYAENKKWILCIAKTIM